MTKKFQNDQKAMALVAVLSIMTILFFLSTAFLWMMDIEREISVNHLGSTQAFYLAQAGLVYGTKAFYDDYTWREAGLTVTLDPGSYTIVCVDHASIEEAATLYSTGNAGNACRTLKKDLSNASFSMIYALLSDTNINRDAASGPVIGDVHANVNVNLAGATITGTVTDSGDDPVTVPKINMAAYERNATQTFTGNQTFTGSDFYNDLISNDIVYVGASETEPGLVTIHTVKAPKFVNYTNCVIAAEGGFVLEGSKKITMTNKEDWPLLVTEKGNILESDSTEVGSRNLRGVIATEDGCVEFNYIQLKGAISAHSIDLITGVDINNEGKWAAGEPAGFLGPGTASNWRERY